MENSFKLTRNDNGIAILTMDVPGETMNTLRAEFGEQISTMLEEIKADSQIAGLVVASGKPDSFVAGADISMLDACQTEEDAKQLSQQGHQVFLALEGLNIPVVAAIHGPCLGGGLELALACHQRVCTDSKNHDGRT